VIIAASKNVIIETKKDGGITNLKGLTREEVSKLENLRFRIKLTNLAFKLDSLSEAKLAKMTKIERLIAIDKKDKAI
jgi:hypothetical protein